jgi:Uma2 family endonuclease
MLRDPQTPTVIEYPASDGEPMAETGVHVKAIIAIVSMLWAYFRYRKDVYIGGDMFWYYEEGDPHKRLAPDVFVAFGVTTTERRSWLMWEEQKAPEVVFEITSRSTRAEDLGSKKGLYEWLGVQEYFLFDPLDEYLRPRLQGFRLVNGLYQAIPAAGSEVASDILGLSLYAEKDKLRFHVLQTGAPLPLPDEEADARAAAEAEVVRLREELARIRGEGK